MIVASKELVILTWSWSLHRCLAGRVSEPSGFFLVLSNQRMRIPPLMTPSECIKPQFADVDWRKEVGDRHRSFCLSGVLERGNKKKFISRFYSRKQETWTYPFFTVNDIKFIIRSFERLNRKRASYWTWLNFSFSDLTPEQEWNPGDKTKTPSFSSPAGSYLFRNCKQIQGCSLRSFPWTQSLEDEDNLGLFSLSSPFLIELTLL